MINRLNSCFRYLFLTGLLTSGSVLYAQTWTQKAPFGGGERQYSAYFTVNGKGYIGFGNNTEVNDMWEYDPTANTWTQKAPIPGQTGMAEMIAFTIGNVAYVGMGLSNTMGTSSNFWKFDPVANTWTAVSPYPGAWTRGPAYFSIGANGYVGSGSTDSSFYQYNSLTDTWTKKNDLPAGASRYYGVSFAVGGKGYIGTGVKDGSVVFNDFWQYDPATDTWTQVASLPGLARVNSVGFASTTNGYLVGGYNNNAVTFSDAYQYDPVTNTWQTEPAYGGGPRFAGAGFAINCGVYYGTGASYEGAGFTDYTDFWELAACTSVPLALQPGQVNDSCYGNTIGSAWVTASGGTPPYHYHWQPGGQSTDTITGLGAGLYKVVVTDSLQAADSASVTISQPAAIRTGTILATANAVCPGGSQILTLSGDSGSIAWQSSTDGLTYTAIPGADSTTYQAQPLQGTYYRVNVTSGACAAASPPFMLALDTLPVPVVFATDTIFCHGDSATICTGSGFISYRWNTGDSAYCTTVSTAGSYSVSATDANGCTGVSAPVNISLYPVPADSITTDKPVFCSGDTSLICSSGTFTRYQWNTTDTGACTAATAAGNYYVTVTDGNGCTAESNRLAISIYPVPSVSIIRQGDTLSSFGQVSYRWIRNNVPIDGANGSFYVAHQSGSYAVQVTDTNGCTTISDPVFITAGLQDMTVEEGVSVYPNPSVSGWQLTVSIELLGCALEIFNDEGRLVFKSTIRDPQSTISLNVESGVYYLRMVGADPRVRPLIRKLVKL